MKITEQELNSLLAVEVMKWRMLHKVGSFDKIVPHSKEGYPFEDWNPTSDERHALQVLGAWAEKTKYEYSINFSRSWMKTHSDGVLELFTAYQVLLIDKGYEEIEALNENLCHAICLAVAEAETGIKYELVKE